MASVFNEEIADRLPYPIVVLHKDAVEWHPRFGNLVGSIEMDELTKALVENLLLLELDVYQLNSSVFITLDLNDVLFILPELSQEDFGLLPLYSV